MQHINTKDCILPRVVSRSNVELTATLATSDEPPADWSDGEVVEKRVSVTEGVEGGRGCVEGRRTCVAEVAETTLEDVSIVTAGVVTGTLNGGLVVTTKAPLVSCGLKLVTTDVIPELGVACSRDESVVTAGVVTGTLNGGLVVMTEAPLVSCGLKLVTTDVIPELGVACSRDDGAISATVLEGVMTPPRLDVPTPEEMDAVTSIPSSTTLDVRVGLTTPSNLPLVEATAMDSDPCNRGDCITDVGVTWTNGGEGMSTTTGVLNTACEENISIRGSTLTG